LWPAVVVADHQVHLPLETLVVAAESEMHQRRVLMRGALELLLLAELHLSMHFVQLLALRELLTSGAMVLAPASTVAEAVEGTLAAAVVVARPQDCRKMAVAVAVPDS
jgi:hypothetical protein